MARLCKIFRIAIVKFLFYFKKINSRRLLSGANNMEAVNCPPTQSKQQTDRGRIESPKLATDKNEGR